QGAAWRAVLTEAGHAVPGGGAFSRWVAEPGREVVAFPSRRSPAGGVDLLVVADDPGDIDAVGAATLTLADELTAAGATPVGEIALAAARVAAGIPAAAFEGGEGVLPQEAGMEDRLSYR